MRFTLPHDLSEFEIPDAWWVESGAPGFAPSAPAYAAEAGVVKLSEELTSQSDKTIRSHYCPTQLVAALYVAPPGPAAGVAAQSFAGSGPAFHQASMIGVLQAMRSGVQLRPIEVLRGVPGEARLVPRDGFHRFYASVALGFPMLPVAVFRYSA